MVFNCGPPHGQPDHVLAATVLGMGWLSSVGIAQHLIRELVLRAPRLGADLPPHRELRKDRSLTHGPAGTAEAFLKI